MARRLRRSRYRRSRGYARRSYRRRRIYGKRRAASQQKQRANFVVKSTYTGYIQVDPIVSVLNESNVTRSISFQNVGGSAVLSVYRNLMKSNYFQSIKTMYDQVRVNSCKITITPTTSVLGTGVKQALFVSAWDRNGIDDPKNPPSIAEITSHSSAFQKPLNLDAASWKATRKIAVSTISEKSAFIPTGMMSNTADNIVSDSGFLSGLGQNLSIQWNPQLLIGVMMGATSLAAPTTSQTWGFVAQFEWSLTFRGLRYDVQNNNGSVQQVQAIVNPTAAPSVGIATVPPGTSTTVGVSRALSTIVTPSTYLRSVDVVYKDFAFTSFDISTPYFLNSPMGFGEETANPYVDVSAVGGEKYMIVIAYIDNVQNNQILRVVKVTFGYFAPGATYRIDFSQYDPDVVYYQTIFNAPPATNYSGTFSYNIASVPSGSTADATFTGTLDRSLTPVTNTYGPIKISGGADPPYPTSGPGF